MTFGELRERLAALGVDEKAARSLLPMISKLSEAYPAINHDEMHAVVLQAVPKALADHNPSRSALSSYLTLVVRSRLLNWLRAETTHYQRFQQMPEDPPRRYYAADPGDSTEALLRLASRVLSPVAYAVGRLREEANGKRVPLGTVAARLGLPAKAVRAAARELEFGLQLVLAEAEMD